MIELPCAADIRCSAETIFDLVADFGGQEHRLVTINIPASLRLFQPILVCAFAHESRRTLLALKAYADTLS